MKVLSDIDVFEKRVFVRADLDVPMESTNADRLTTNASVIETSAEFETGTRLTNLRGTINYLSEHSASQILIAGHIDRPQKPDPSLSTKNLLPHLEKILERKINFSPQLTIDNLHLTQDSKSMVNGQMSNVILLENLRFWPGEVANDAGFAKQLAAIGDVYVNEAFGNCHRNHASMVALAQLLPHAAGLHLAEEVEVMSNLLSAATKPFIAVVGGAKIETKLPVIENLAKVADLVLVGGELPLEIAESGMKFSPNVLVAILTPDGLEISQESTGQFAEKIKVAKTIIWNGPLGKYEEGHDKGTLAVASAVIDSQAYSVVGGGETTQFLATHGLISKFSFVSAGGGAMLAYLAGKELPGLKALE